MHLVAANPLCGHQTVVALFWDQEVMIDLKQHQDLIILDNPQLHNLPNACSVIVEYRTEANVIYLTQAALLVGILQVPTGLPPVGQRFRAPNQEGFYYQRLIDLDK